MADALGSGPSEGNFIGVQVPSRAKKDGHKTVFFYIVLFLQSVCKIERYREENMRSVSLVLNVICFVMLTLSLVLDMKAGRQVNMTVRLATLVLLAASIVFNILIILKR